MKALDEKMKAGEKLTDADEQRLQELSERLDAFNDDLSLLAENVKDRIEQKNLYEFESGYKDALSKLSEQLAAQSGDAQALQSLAENPDRSPEDLAKAMEQFRKNSNPFSRRQQQEQKRQQ